MFSRREDVLNALEDIVFGLLRQLEDNMHEYDRTSDTNAKSVSKRIEIGLSRRDGMSVIAHSHIYLAAGSLIYIVGLTGLWLGLSTRTALGRLVSWFNQSAAELPIYNSRLQARLLHVADTCHEAVTQGVIITKRCASIAPHLRGQS